MSGWDENRTALLRRLWTEGKSATEIMKTLQAGGWKTVSRNAVIGKVHRLNLEARMIQDQGQRRKPKTVLQRRFARPSAPPLRTERMAKEKPMPDPKLDPLRREDGSTFSILDLTETTCRFPIGDPKEKDFAFCGRDVDGVSPYCAEHHRVCLVKPESPRRYARSKAA